MSARRASASRRPPLPWAELEAAARGAREQAHAPYSAYRVGAALAVRTGNVLELFVGCNVENASYGLCLCAERSAVAAMVAAGARDPVGLVVVTEGPEPGSPCGMCRQVLAEFALDLPVLLVAARGHGRRRTSLAKLLPDAFRGALLPAAPRARRGTAAPRPKR